jgi:hypothetical protein
LKKNFRILVVGEISPFATEKINTPIFQFFEERGVLLKSDDKENRVLVSFSVENSFTASETFSLLIEKDKVFDIIFLDKALKGSKELRNMLIPNGHSFVFIPFDSKSNWVDPVSFESLKEIICLSEREGV